MRTTRTRTLVAAVCAAIALLQATPATADSIQTLRQKQSSARAKRVAAAAKLDAAKASDQELSTAVANLNNAVHAQVAATDAVSAQALINDINNDQRLGLHAVSEKEYYELQTRSGAPIEGSRDGSSSGSSDA